MKNLLTLLATAVIVNLAIAQGTPAAAKVNPDLLVLKETSFDFSKIQQGRPVTHDFLIANSSTDTLKIEDVRASCGCTTPVWKREPVAPNSNTKITVGYNAYNEGPFEKTVTITYNGGQVKMLTIKGTVFKAPATAAPENQSVDLLKKSNQ
ncbi:MAG: DUF1573 domain-containing protein [Bacteroidota bacterium]|nr:DUF1573 domain-containing protein [Bacteroidota bacterium]